VGGGGESAWAGAMIVFRSVARFHAARVIVFRKGTPRPERPTMTRVFVQPVERGDSEDGVSMPASGIGAGPA
jgi:hypothetical protein